MFDVVSVGEAVIDFSLCGKGNMGNPAYEMNPGGSSCNLLIPNAMLGGKTAYIGLVGQDMFGDYIISYLKKRNVNTDSMRQTTRATTRLSFVTIDSEGDRRFDFVKGSGMDHMLEDADVDFSIIAQAKIVNTEYCNMVDSVGAKTLFHILEFAKERGIATSFDFNYRPNVFADEEEGVAYLKKMLSYADYVKVSEAEMAMITGLPETECEKGAKMILDMGKKAVFVTMGPGGACFATQEECGYVPGFQVKAVDTTGCGDAFMGTVQYYLTHDHGFSMTEVVRRANAMGALCATKPGGMDSIPTRQEFEEFLNAEEKRR